MPGAGKYTKIGPYILTDTIGVGSFSKVKLCVHEQTWDRYACKVIEKSLIRDRMFNVQVKREIEIMRQLRHENTVSLVSVHSSATKVFIVMELVTGCELYDEVYRLKRLSEPYARYYFRQLINGLQYCHSNGIFHRDLKPDNLLVNPDLTLKITDFGLATLKAGAATNARESISSSLNLHTQCGTPNYVPPEIINIDPNGYSGAKVDIWACGIILFVLVAGQLPFDSPDVALLFKSIVRCDISYPEYFSEDLKDLISNLLKIDPKDRYSLEDVQQHPWYQGPTEYKVEGFSRKIPPIPIRIGVPLAHTPLSPVPEGNSLGGYRGLKRPGSTSSGMVMKEPNKDSKDSLDFGTRVEPEPVASDPTNLILPNGRDNDLQSSTQTTPATDAIEHNVGVNGGNNELESPLSASDSAIAGEEAPVGNHRDSSQKETTNKSEFSRDEKWVHSDADRLVWCRMMKDFDMVPDILEFDMDSATLNERWQKGLAKEKLRKHSSFTADRFGVRQITSSRSANYLPSSTMHSEMETNQGERKVFNQWDYPIPFAEQSGSVASAVRMEGDMTRFEKDQHSDTDSLMSHEDTIPLVPLHTNGALQGQEVDAQYEVLPAEIPNPSFLRSSEEEEIPAAHPLSVTELSKAHNKGRPPSFHFMGEGQDLLEQNKVRPGSGFTEPARNDQGLVISEPSSLETGGIANVLRHNFNRRFKAPSAIQHTAPDPRGKSLAVAVEENKREVLSPFALDVPGPRRALPVKKTLFGSIVPSTVSVTRKRLLRKSSEPLEVKSQTQFNSLLKASSSFDVIQGVLREYGCSIIRTTSERSGEKFQIRCELKKDDATVNAGLSIFRVSDDLSRVQFKRLLHTNTKEFGHFCSDISRLYFESVRQHDFAEDSAKKDRRSKHGMRVQFTNTSYDDTVDDISL